MRLISVLFIAAVPLWAQYAGPAILSRGQAPATIDRAQISFQPFIELRGSYETGLAGVAVNSSGDLANASSFGYSGYWGISGAHSWRHTSVGVAYRGSAISYLHSSFYDSINQSLLVDLNHQFNPHLMVNLSESAGNFSTDYGLGALQQTISFDPTATYVPVTDFFDNRTYYFATHGDLIFQKTRRLSFYIGGDVSDVGRRSAALYGSLIEDASGDFQYRLTSHMTVGATYSYAHFGFTGSIGTTDVHTGTGSFGYSLSRTLEFTGFGGVSRVENKFLQSLAVDPVIAAIIGTSSNTEIVHGIAYVPAFGARLSQKLRTGILYLGSWYRVTPGNGLFLTSYSTEFLAGYNYTGLRRWTVGTYVSYDRSKSVGNVQGIYTTMTSTSNIGRKIKGPLHFVGSYSAVWYNSPDFTKYRRFVNQVSVGFGFTPGEIPLRIW